ncbi:asparagine synthase-related protein [Spongiactinospora sp. TRM90649]|uniref:asparagine synthase-related protein n=1 Tax=Spongiactinospora sp. TRM90649 TaxID=3031114 RepID=UPI0023F95266|nr:asparagine synthase-related protein [Spongiactinospora sp. TRM90649]MDF5752460.1 asparagine synthase-related protein [Spongiactinospora sp. TRM90649]
MRGELWFAVLPDGEAGLAAAGSLRPWAGGVIDHASGRPWLVGEWPGDQIRHARAGTAQVAVIGRCPVSAADLARRLDRIRDLDDVERVVAGLPGSFHLIASVGGRVRIRGAASAVRRVFHARLAGATVAASRSDVLATAIGATVDERVLAARLLPRGTAYPLQELSVWRGVQGVPPDHCLILEPDGTPVLRRWWSPPEPALPLAEGAEILRDTLAAAVGSCAKGGAHHGDTISADLSGGLDSTALCFLAGHGPARLVTLHCQGIDPGNDDSAWARSAAAALPNARHLSVDRDEIPLWFGGLAEPRHAIEEPSGWVRDTARMAYLTDRLIAAGSHLHLTGVGGDELFTVQPSYLHDLIRRHPLTALAHLRARRARWRRPWWPVLRALADRDTHGAWLARCAGGLSAGQADGPPYSMAWGPSPRMPAWATPDAVRAAKSVLAEVAAGDPPPLAGHRAQHAALLRARTAGAGLRQIDQATSRLGLPHAAPYLDDAVVEAVLSVRPHERGTPERYKPLLGAAMTDVVPRTILARSTKGEYDADFYAGLRRHRAELLELFGSSLLGRLGLIDTGAMRAVLVGPHPRPHAMAPLSQTLACEVWLRSLAGRERMPAMANGGY